MLINGLIWDSFEWKATLVDDMHTRLVHHRARIAPHPTRRGFGLHRQILGGLKFFLIDSACRASLRRIGGGEFGHLGIAVAPMVSASRSLTIGFSI
jgi:hypothetical protein